MVSVTVSDLDYHHTNFLIRPRLNSSTPILFNPSMPLFAIRLLPTFDMINGLFQNRLFGWELANAQGNHTIPQPVLAIYPKEVRTLISSPFTVITLVTFAS